MPVTCESSLRRRRSQLEYLVKQKAALLAITLVLGVMIWVMPPSAFRYGLAFVLLWLLPGLAWATLIPQNALDRAELLTVGLGLGFVVTPIATLSVHYLPGPVDGFTLLVVILGLIILPLVLSALRRPNEKLRATSDRATKSQLWEQRIGSKSWTALWRDGWVWLIVALTIAAALRIVNLDYSEFQGDEAVVMVRAAEALEGDDAVLFQHKKGPLELTVAMASWRLAGITNEWMARLPYAWASILGVMAVFLFGRRLDRPHAGGIAACLLAIEGFRVGFGRIVQYQSIVFALSTLGLLCLFAYYRRGRGDLLVVGATLFAGGALAHYDALLVLPAGLLSVIVRMWQARQRIWRALVPLVAAGIVGVVLLGIFYLPFFQSPYVENTSFYISSRVGGQALFHNNLRPMFELSAVYNAVYLLGFMALALAGQTVVTWARWGPVGFVLSCILLVAASSGLFWPERWIVAGQTWAWIPSVLLLLGSLLAPGQSIGLRSAWLWLGVPSLFYLFLVALPLTHIHMAFPAWAVLTGIAVTDLGIWLMARSKPALWVARGAAVVLFTVNALYAVIVFVDHTPEYRRTFPQSKHPLYWTPYEQMPEAGLFGFPYRVGWKVVGSLIDEGRLAGSYDSNEEKDVTDFYTRRAIRWSCASPDFYVTAVNVQDEAKVDWDQIETEYQPDIVVTVDGTPKLSVYQRNIERAAETYQVEAYTGLFDRGSTPDRYSEVAILEGELVNVKDYTPLDVNLGNFARLLGYHVDTRKAKPGGYVELTLIWQALATTSADYHVFTHLHDGEMMRGQLDGQPSCDNLPTSLWQPGQYLIDPYRIPIREDAPPGPVPLTIGMYDFVTMQRLPVAVPDGSVLGDNVHLANIEIQAP